MKKKISLLVGLCFVFTGIFLGSTAAEAASASHVVISEVYGGGGNSGSSYNNDFIELYNPTDSSVNLSGWSVQYASATSSFNNITNLSGSIGTLSNTTSAEREDNNGGTTQGQGNGWDTNNNASDLYITSSINPQNSSSQAEPSLSTETPPATVADNDNLALGNPSGATSSTSNANNYLMIKPQYDLSYNNSKHEPNWVSWHLDSSDLGSTSRQDDFRADTTLPSGWYRVIASEFSGSGFDRGHMCPSADRTSSVANNSATFLMTNMIPQAPNNNQITWANLETYSRTLISSGNELYIISGGYGTGGTGSNGYMTTVGNGVVVPAKTWKIIVVLPNGNNDINRITTQTRVIAVLMPNNQTCNSQPWGNYRVTVDSIEALTGYDFLSSVPASIQNIIEASTDKGPTN